METRTTGRTTGQNQDSLDPVPVPLGEAAERLGLRPDAIRKRLDRGRIQGFRAPNGRIFVLMTAAGLVPTESGQPDRTRTEPGQTDRDAIIAVLQDQVMDLRARLDRAEAAQGELRQLLLVAERNVAALAERLALPAPGAARDRAERRGRAARDAVDAVDAVVVEAEPAPPPSSMADILARFRSRTSH